MGHGDFLLITPGASGNPPHDPEGLVCDEEALGPPSVPLGSGPEPRGHLHDSASAFFRKPSASLSKALVVFRFFSALVSGRRWSAALDFPGEK